MKTSHIWKQSNSLTLKSTSHYNLSTITFLMMSDICHKITIKLVSNGF